MTGSVSASLAVCVGGPAGVERRRYEANLAAERSVMPRRPFAAYLPKLFRAAMLALPLVLAAGQARAQDNADLIERVQRLESDLQILQRQVYRGVPPAGGAAPSAAPLAPGAAASLEGRVSQLEEEVQALTGKIEEAGHNVVQMQARLEKLSQDVDARLSKLEQGQTATATPQQQQQLQQPEAATAGQQPVLLVPPPQQQQQQQQQAPQQQAAPILVPPAQSNEPPPKPVQHVVGNGQVLPVGTAQQQYDYSRALLVQQDYDSAEAAFKAFVNTHPDDPLAGAAQYWLGETYYLRGNFQDSAGAFATSYEKFPKGIKAPDSLLKLGMSLAKLNRKKDACAVFASLASKYPNAPANLRQSAARERQVAGCG
jgi:tol-pal system protein YbgF